MSATMLLGRYAGAGAALSIRLSSRPRWRAAHEVSDYVARFLDADLQQSCGSAELAQATAADVRYAVSELIENATKYSLPGSVELDAGVVDDAVVVTLRHALSPQAAARYADRARAMLAGDPTEQLIAAVERHAAGEGEGGSGLGLLSLLSDYGARLGFAFDQEDQVAVRVSTQAHLPLRH